MVDYEQMYFEHKKKIVIEAVQQFKKRWGNDAFPYELDQNELDLEKLFCNSHICSGCGCCCHEAPCIFSPYDFLDLSDEVYMKRILATGLLCISRLPENEEILVLRPRGRDDGKFIVSMTYNWNHCILENGEGCMLDAKYRPLQGLLYVPEEDGFSHSIIYPYYIIEEQYREFQEFLKTLATNNSELFINQNKISEEQ